MRKVLIFTIALIVLLAACSGETYETEFKIPETTSIILPENNTNTPSTTTLVSTSGPVTEFEKITSITTSISATPYTMVTTPVTTPVATFNTTIQSTVTTFVTPQTTAVAPVMTSATTFEITIQPAVTTFVTSHTIITAPTTPASTFEFTAQAQPTEFMISSENNEMYNITITVKEIVFNAKLYDNDTVKTLLTKLPLMLNMTDLHKNEKYYYLPDRLPIDLKRVENINAGDLMLYGSDCLVLFYENLTTPYSYTRLGYIEDVTGLANALGNGDVQVAFNIAD